MRVFLPPVMLLLVACQGRQSALDPKGPLAHHLYDLWLVMLVGGATVFVLVLGFLGVGLAIKSEPSNRRRGKGVAVATGTTVVLLVALLAYNMLVSRAITAEPEIALEVEVVAHQWWWEVHYPEGSESLSIRTANELHIPVGRPVSISLRSGDVIHSFWVPNLHGKLDAIPGQENRFWLQADEAGEYRGQCAEFCGLQHALMAFLVVAEPEADFERWRAQQQRPVAPPRDERAERGHLVFMESGCPMCHSLRGVSQPMFGKTAMAVPGPDLTHLASRRTLAAATVANKRGQLAGWILDPQHIKPGNFMPRSDLSGERMLSLVHYLETLE